VHDRKTKFLRFTLPTLKDRLHLSAIQSWAHQGSFTLERTLCEALLHAAAWW